MRDTLPTQLSQILAEEDRLGDAFLVGGCVRDWLLKLPNKDFDVEVYGLGYDELVEETVPEEG